jgi:hypothetical protein
MISGSASGLSVVLGIGSVGEPEASWGLRCETPGEAELEVAMGSVGELKVEDADATGVGVTLPSGPMSSCQ